MSRVCLLCLHPAKQGAQQKSAKGLWIVSDPVRPPDIVIYYIHGTESQARLVSLTADRRLGGGFLMGSAYFYLEVLLSWRSILVASGYQNPVIFALEYTLVPDGVFPQQLDEAAHAYEHVLCFARDPSRIVVSGDSAGATIVLSLLLHIARAQDEPALSRLPKPGLAVLVSPWVTLQSRRYRNTRSDYLDVERLSAYASRYAGIRRDRVISPGDCHDVHWWREASPSSGIVVTYGAEEVFAPEIEAWVEWLREGGVDVENRRNSGAIHAWPVASLFLSSSTEKRLKGLKDLTESIHRRIPPAQSQRVMSD